MKKVLLVSLIAGLAAGSANAATLWMQFAGGANEVTLHPTETVVVEIYMSGIRGAASPTPDRISAGQWSNMTALGLEQQSVTAGQPGWTPDQIAGVLGSNEVSIAADTANAFIGLGITPAMNVLLARQILHQNLITGRFELMFLADVATAKPTIRNAAGLTWAIVKGTGTNPLAGQFEITKGSPGYSYMVGYDTLTQPKLPLIVNCIPEPASLALLALGVVAGLRRRS